MPKTTVQLIFKEQMGSLRGKYDGKTDHGLNIEACLIAWEEVPKYEWV